MSKKLIIGLSIIGLGLLIGIGGFIFFKSKDANSEVVNSTSENVSDEIQLLVPTKDQDKNNEDSNEVSSNKKYDDIQVTGSQDVIITDYKYDPTKPIIGAKPKEEVSIEIEGIESENYIPYNPEDGVFGSMLDNINFNYAYRDTGFSRGFALNPKGNYQARLIYADSFECKGPNNTMLVFKEVDYTKGNIDYWHTDIFHHLGFMQYNIGKPEGSIPYGSPFVEGEGLKDYYKILGPSIIMNGEFDTTIKGDYQLLSDDKLSCKFGEGYLVEYYNISRATYYGEAVIENSDGRIIWIKANTPYYPSLKSIVMEFADTCVHLY